MSIHGEVRLCRSFLTVSKHHLQNAAFTKTYFCSTQTTSGNHNAQWDHRHQKSNHIWLYFSAFCLIMTTFVTQKTPESYSRKFALCSTKKTKGKGLKTQRQGCTLMAVSRYYAGDFLPSATFGAQQGAHGGAGRTKIAALLRILVSLAGHGSLGRKTWCAFLFLELSHTHTHTHTHTQRRCNITHTDVL